MGAGMDDLDNDIKRTIDDYVDEQELLPYRYQYMLGKAKQACNDYPKKPEILVEREQK